MVRRAEEDRFIAIELQRAGVPVSEKEDAIRQLMELARDRSPEWILLAGIVMTTLIAGAVAL